MARRRVRLSALVGAAALCLCLLAACDPAAAPAGTSPQQEKAKPGTPGQPGNPPAQGASDGNTPGAAPGTSPTTETGTGIGTATPPTEAKPGSREWDTRLRAIAGAFPRDKLSGAARAGSWTDAGFSESASGLPAVSALYKAGTTDMVLDVPSNSEVPSLLNVRYEQSAEFTVIDAGSELQRLWRDVEDRMGREGWERKEASMPTVDGARKFPHWRRGKLSVYMAEHEGLLLYAVEHEGESEIGAGRSTSLGAQRFVQFFVKYPVK